MTHARLAARTDAAGDLVPLADQDRSRRDRDLIERGVRLVEATLAAGPVGPFQLQAAIAAVHAEAATADATDWAQIVVLFDMLEHLDPSPVVTLNRAVAIGMADGPTAGIDALAPLLDAPPGRSGAASSARSNHRVHAAHAHLLDLAGRHGDAAAEFRRAAALTASIPEQRYLNRRALECDRRE